MQGHDITITINEQLRTCADPLTATEYAALERSLVAEGCRDALVLWGSTLIDGHNRYDICRKHDIAFRTVQNDSFASIEEVMLWMIDNHLARRSVSDYQRGVLALRRKALMAVRTQVAAPEVEEGDAPPWSTREDVARAARVSSNTIGQIERIEKAATRELREAVRAGTISINAAATVAQLPESVQIAAVAGGRKELQQVARQVREQKQAARPKPEKADELTQLRTERAELKDRLATLLTENARLRQMLESAGITPPDPAT